MKEALLKMLLKAMAIWAWASYEEPASTQGYSQEELTDMIYETDEASSDYSRGFFSAYVVTGVDCMDNGAYEQYVEFHVNQDNPEAEPEPQIRDDGFPVVYFKFMGLDLTDYYEEAKQQDYYFNKAFCSDIFYMEYPSDWYVGTADSSALTFVSEWEEEASSNVIHDWDESFDENLKGDKAKVQEYIEGGGINEFLEEVIGKPMNKEYKLICQEQDSEEDWLLIYDLKKEDKEAAQVIVWCNLGKVNARNQDIDLTVDPKDDYGRILVFEEWDEIDFSSADAIEEYVESEDFLYRLLGEALEEDMEQKIISFEKGSFTSEYHEFVCVDVALCDYDNPEKVSRQAAVYIPITKPYNKNWVVVFETFPGSKQKENVYNSQVRERIMKTFVSLPYYHEVEKGENLSIIAQQYGENPNLAYEIAAYKTNNIKQPDKIFPGQKIEIPLGILFKKEHH